MEVLFQTSSIALYILQAKYEIKKITISRVLTPSNSERARRFGGAYRLHLQGRVFSK
jgi:hypothetical protein